MARILVIDDEASIRDLIRQVLLQTGHEVIEAFDGRDGFDRFKECPADLVITDLLMPRMDGLDLIHQICNELSSIRIISITAGMGNDWALAREAGATRTLVKPIKVDELLETVTELL